MYSVKGKSKNIYFGALHIMGGLAIAEDIDSLIEDIGKRDAHAHNPANP